MPGSAGDGEDSWLGTEGQDSQRDLVADGRTDSLAGTVALTSPGADPVVVDPDHEARQLTEVQERLQARFPEVDPTVVAAAIQVAASQITGPIRDFVPLLVERAARARLERALSGEATPTTEVERAEKRHGSAAADAG